MTTEEMRIAIENELTWRKEEILFFKNQLVNINGEEKQNKYRKSLILILYSHLEGFMKISLQTYIEYINSLDIERNRVNRNLLASSLHKELNAYDNLDRKCRYFGKLPDDSKLHRFGRRIDLVEKMEEFRLKKLYIEDEVIDTESNLWYIVLQKNLYKIGIPIDIFDEHKNVIDMLVNRRNGIAHGSERSGVSKGEYEKMEREVFQVMEDTNRILYDYAVNKKYLLQ